MLQINSGKLFQSGVGRTNKLRGVLYTNLVLAGLDDLPIETAAGNLLPAEPLGFPGSVVYELTERLEDGRMASGVLISHTVKPYLNDFSFVVAFSLNVTCTPDHDLTARLLSDRGSSQLLTAPSKLIKRVFDKQIWCQPQDRDFLKEFVDDLLGLRRANFLKAMKAIRTYVTALHRIADDLELAYTLLIAAVESLAQGFDDFSGTWTDYDEAKRKKIDAALETSDSATAQRVRATLVEIEHLALARRFREFTLAHIDPSYYKETGRVGALGPLDVRDALREAYNMRSRYVHNLQGLPDMLSMERSFSESQRIDHRTFLTLEGLARLVRHVVLEFVRREPKVETEVYNYSSERHGIIQAELSPEYWIGRPEAVHPAKGRRHLEGFLVQFAGHLQTGAPITNLRAVLPRLEEIFPEVTKKQRRPLLALYCLYNKLVPEDERASDYKNILSSYQDELAEPSVEALFTHLLMSINPRWSITIHKQILQRYFDQRNRTTGLRVPALFEAGIALEFSERLRADNQIDAARDILKFAAMNIPGLGVLDEFERTFDPKSEIDWGAVLLPNRK